MASPSLRVSGKNSKGGGICAVLFGFVFFAMGGAFMWVIAADFFGDLKTYQWVETPCQIDSVEVIADQSQGDSPFRMKVAFSYQFEGASYQSDKYKSSESWKSDYEPLALDRKEILERADGGSTCFVDPENPTTAIMKRASLAKGLLIFLPLIFVVIGLAIMLGGFVSLKKEKAIKAGKKQAAISSDSAIGKKSGKGILLVMGVIFTLIGGGLFIGIGLMPMLRLFDAKNWVETPCEVVWSRVISHEGDDSTTYSVDIFYKYEFEGQKHRSNRFSFAAAGSSSGRSGKTAVVKQYPKGAKKVCFVNPELPEQAVIQGEFSPSMLLGLIPLVFLFAGIAMLVGGLRSKKSKNWAHESPEFDAGNRYSGSERNTTTSGPQILKPGGSRFGQVLGVLFFALFWNGIISVFLWQVVKGFQKGRPEWFLTIFMIPFVLIGLAAICMFLYKMLTLANPQPVLTIEPGTVRLGEEGFVSWKLKGNARRVSRLFIEFHGIESATYRRGTNTVTDKEIFYCKRIFDSADMGGSSSQIKSGRTQFKLPVDLIPSLNLSNNDIFWQLKINGDIPLWPDIQDSYKVEVLPATFS